MDATPEFRRDVLVSIRPIYAAKILKGEKTVELRRKFPKVGAIGGLALIYASRPISAVIGYAQIKNVLKLPVFRLWKDYGVAACISKDEFDAYFSGLECGFVILFDGVEPLKRQLNAVELEDRFGIVPPQSYRYLPRERFDFLSDEQFQTSHRHEHTYRARRRSARAGFSR